MRQFEKLLSKVRLSRAEAGNRAFDSAFCRPPSGHLRERWEALRREREHRAGARKTPAQTILLSYGARFGSLWLLEASGSQQSEVALGVRAQHALERATLLVSRELPALVGVPERWAPWSVSRIRTEGERVLDGDSFGLSMCIAAAAHCLDLPSPSTVAATACVDGDGVLFEVGGLAEKLCVLYEWALGVEVVVVAASQLEKARTIARELGASWQIVPARTVADAVAAVFPNFWADLHERWVEDAKVRQVAGDLFRLARDGSNHVLSWSAIANAAERVVARLPEQSLATKEARFAQLVALRHEGHDAPLELDCEFLAGMRRPLRLRCLAHIVQSHGDCADALDPAIEAAVVAMLPADRCDDSVDDLWLLGALGRTLAAFFRYEAAGEALRRALEGWFELDRAAGASHALSELLRVVALSDGDDSFSHVVREYAEPLLLDPRTDSVSRGFVLYSLGRGHALLGKHAEANRRLSDGACDWTLLPEHLRALRLRWLTRVLRAQGDAVRADDCMERLARTTERAPMLRVVAVLAELDRAQYGGGNADEALRAFEISKPREFRRFESAYGADQLAARVVREYRY